MFKKQKRVTRRVDLVQAAIIAVVAGGLPFAGCQSTNDGDAAAKSLPAPVAARGLSRHYVEVAFPAEVGDAAEVPGAYDITADDGTKLPVMSAHRTSDGGTVILTTTEQQATNYMLALTGQADGGGNGTAGAGVSFAATMTPEPQLLYATSLSNTSVLLTFDGPLDEESAQDARHYRIADPDLNVVSALRGGNGNEHTVTLTTTPQTDLLYEVIVTNVSSAPASLLVDPTSNTANFYGINLFDETAPRLLEAEAVDYENVLLTFSEPLENFSNDVASYSISPDLPIVAALPNEWGTQVTLMVRPVVAGVEYELTIDQVEDRSGNVIDGSNNQALFGIPADETIPPEIVSAVALDCETILVTFSEPMMDSAGDPSRYALTPSRAIILAELSEFKTQVLLTTQPLESGTEYTLTATELQDSVGNLISEDHDEIMFSCQSGSNTDALGPLPRIVGAASLSNTTLIIGYDRPMGDVAADPARYVIVQTDVNPEVGALPVSSAEFPGEDRTVVLLTTASQNEVTYEVTAVGIRDEQGNPLAPPIGFTGLVLVAPDKATFPGTPPGDTDLVDTDDDGLYDNEEIRGRRITITRSSGEEVYREVTSSPFDNDTDNDGLGDARERSLNTNPRDPDTDGDSLTDEREFNLYYSSPVAQDSDEDGVSDGSEVNFFKTAPLLSDTDGDGFSDGEELFELSRNPNIADLPRPNIVADNIFLQINEKFTYTDTEGQTATETSTSQATLTQSTETKFSTTDTDVLKVGAEVAVEVSASPSVTIGANFGAEFTTQTSAESARAAQNQYQRSVSKAREITTARQVTREIDGASVNATVTIVDEGDIAFTIGNLELSVLQQTGPNRSQFLPVATLVPAGGNNSFNLGPLIPERGPFIFENTDVFPNLVQDLMRAPRGLIVKVANFDMTDEFGRNFAFTSQEVNDRTAEIRLDFGDGRSDRFRIATYGGLDEYGYAGPAGDFVGGFDDKGKSRGIPLDFALQNILGLVKNPAEFDAIVAGEDGFADTVAEGDDVQEVPPATTGLDDREVVVSAGANGVLDTVAPSGDDFPARTQGYDTSPTCNADTLETIIEPELFGDGVVSTEVSDLMRCSNDSFGIDGLGTCMSDDDCDSDAPCEPGEADCEGACELASDDIQMVAAGDTAMPGEVVIDAGPNGVLETVAQGDDQRRGPGDPCESDDECSGAGLCNAREVITRIENSINGDRNRFWIALTSNQIPVGTDVGQVNLRPGFVLLLAFIQDVDRDGLSAQEEYLHGSSDRKKDTDEDGLGDFAEIRLGWTVETVNAYHAYSDPRLADSDGDFKTDPEEMEAGTDPRLSDTDVDGIDDNYECANESGNPLPGKKLLCGPGEPASACLCPVEANNEVCELNPLRPDSDGDGLDDGREVELGTCPLDADSGPEFLDTDEDGLTNAQELTPRDITFVNCNGDVETRFNVTTDPSNGDTDFDGLPDLLEVGSAMLGIPGLGSDPRDVDSDNDGLLDFDEFANFALYQHLNLELPGFFLVEGDSQRIGTDLTDCDTDGDGLTDTFEREGGWTVLATGDATARTVTSSPLSADTDADGLADGDEFLERTDPTDPDTDGDGRRDGDEVNAGSNPLDPDISVRVMYRRIAFIDGPEYSGSSAEGAEWEWSLRIRRPVDGTSDGMIADLHTCQPSLPTVTIVDLDVLSSSFVLRPGDTFDLNGIVLERDFCCNYSYEPEDVACWGSDCEDNFCPGCPDCDNCCFSAAASCVGSFNRTFSFEDLVGGPDHVVGNIMLGAETFINIEGGDENDNCQADIQFEIFIE